MSAENGKAYQVCVRATNAIDSSAWSAAASTTPGQTPAPAPTPAPTLTNAFAGANIAEGTTVTLNMADHFSGDDLSYAVSVTITATDSAGGTASDEFTFTLDNG